MGSTGKHSRAVPAGELGQLLEGDGVDERIGVPVRQPPLVPDATEHQGDAQRPVLVRQAAHFAVLALDQHQHRGVVRGVGLCELDGGLAGGEELADLADVLRRGVEPVARLTTNGWMSV
jgi:hypothetical protein